MCVCVCVSWTRVLPESKGMCFVLENDRKKEEKRERGREKRKEGQEGEARNIELLN